MEHISILLLNSVKRFRFQYFRFSIQNSLKHFKMYFVVFLETDRQGDYVIDAQNTPDMHIYNTEPFLIGIQYCFNQPESFHQRFKVSNGNFQGYLDIRSEFKNVGIYTFIVYTQDGHPTKMYSKFDIQLVTPYLGDLNDPMNVEFPQRFSIGHRGNGMNKYTTEILENTIPSFKKAAKTGARFVEFDVQYTNDGIPVIFHDFTLKSPCVYKKAEYVKKDNDIIEYAIHQLSLKQFKKAGMKTSYGIPYNSLHDLLVGLPEDISFDMEMKSIYEEPHLIDDIPYPNRNELIDAVLEELEEFGKKRQIFFTSFDPMMVIMLSLKQSKYPILQLSCKEDFEDEKTAMSRLSSLVNAYKWLDVRGFVLDSDLVLQHKRMIQEMKKDYLLCTYGKYNTSESRVIEQLDLGIRGICTDSISCISQIVDSYN